jgi:hypothetical protein
MPAQETIDQQRREFGYPALQPANANAGPILQMDLSTGLTQQFTLNANCFITEPVNPPDPGAHVVLILTQDVTGSRSVTWSIAFRDAPSWSAGAAKTHASALFIYDGACYQYVGGSSAFAVSGMSLVPNTGALGLATDPAKVGVNPAPTVGAAALAGVAPVLTANTIVTRTPTVGAVAAAGVAPLVSTILTPPAAGLNLQGQIPTRTSP